MTKSKSVEESGQLLSAVIRVKHPPDSNCPIMNSGDSGDVISQSVVNTEDGAECRAVVQLDDEQHATFVKSSPDDDCLRTIFESNKCIFSPESFEHGHVLYSLESCNREELCDLTQSLREKSDFVKLEHLYSRNFAKDKSLVLDTTSITDKQMEAVRTADTLGYFDKPRRADLGDVADELGISPSAVSKRLKCVEDMLMTQLSNRRNGSE